MATFQRPPGTFRPPTLGASEQIAWQLRQYLEEKHLGPNDRIGTEQELADEFGVSRPTLREALRLLSASQLIRVERGRSGGIFVARTPSEGMSRSLSDTIGLMLATNNVSLDQLLDARLTLEVPIAGRAAVHADDAAIRRLEEAVVAAEAHEPGSPPFSEADTRFHQTLAEASGNELLRGLTAWILEVLQPTLIEAVGAHTEAEQILDQHRAILRAVRRHQRPAAERAMAAHITYLIDVLDQLRG